MLRHIHAGEVMDGVVLTAQVVVNVVLFVAIAAALGGLPVATVATLTVAVH
jgi:hypothetical protein